MAKFETDAIAGSMRIAASYWDKRGVVSRAETLRRWADELDPPAIKCTSPGCDSDALFRAELPAAHDGELAHVTFRCVDHVASWLGHNAPFGSIKVDLM